MKKYVLISGLNTSLVGPNQEAEEGSLLARRRAEKDSTQRNRT